MIALFDAYAGFGGSGPGQRRTVTADDLSGEMSRLEIQRALVRTAPEELDADTEASNEALLSAGADRPAFAPCPIVVPNTAGDGPDEDEQIERLLARGAAAVTVRPKADYWLPTGWVADRLFAGLQARRVPVLCRTPEVPLEQVADLAGRFGELPILLAETGYRWQRVVLGLLKAFGNVHLCTGAGFSVHRGIEQLVAAVGPQRVLFGSGFPRAEPAAAVCQLLYADVPEEARALIGAGNLRRLVEAVVR